MSDHGRPVSARGPGARRRAREVALAALYRADLLDLSAAATLASLPEVFALSEEPWPQPRRQAHRLRAEALAYAHEILTGVMLDREAIDGTIDGLAIDWRLDRLSITDRNLLRLSLWELNRGEPPAVVVNEAVEIAQEYGGPESSRFVNGILGAWVRRQDRGDREPGAGAAEAGDQQGGAN